MEETGWKKKRAKENETEKNKESKLITSTKSALRAKDPKTSHRR
jgi:hypothetical protein